MKKLLAGAAGLAFVCLASNAQATALAIVDDGNAGNGLETQRGITIAPAAQGRLGVDLRYELRNPAPQSSGYFGYAVAIQGDQVLVGSALQNDPENDSGAADLYDLGNLGATDVNGNAAPVRTHIPNPQTASRGGDEFGSAVAFAGEQMLIGAVNTDSDNGSVFVFDSAGNPATNAFTGPGADGATNQNRIASPFADPTGALMGDDIAVAGNRVLFGARGVDTGNSNAGGAALYDFSQTGGADNPVLLFNPDPDSQDQQGRAIAVSDRFAILGSDLDHSCDGCSDSAGRAWVHVGNSGFEMPQGKTRLQRNLADPFDLDPDATVASNENSALLKNVFDNMPASNIIVTYGDMDRDGLIDSYALNNPSRASTDWFAGESAVATWGNYALIGDARDDSLGATDRGTAFLFDLTTGENVLTLYGFGSGDLFGNAVAMTEDFLIVGANSSDHSGIQSAGSVYLFDYEGNLLTTIDNPFATNTGEDFGVRALAMDGNRLVIGAHLDDDGSQNTGTAYVYELSDLSGDFAFDDAPGGTAVPLPAAALILIPGLLMLRPRR